MCVCVCVCVIGCVCFHIGWSLCLSKATAAARAALNIPVGAGLCLAVWTCFLMGWGGVGGGSAHFGVELWLTFFVDWLEERFMYGKSFEM